MIGHRQHESARLELIKPLSVPEHLRETVREVFDLRSDEQRKGHASALMRKVCAEADNEAKVLMLMVTQPDDAAIDNEKLCKFYGRFGFKATKDGYESPVVMIRALEAGNG